MCSEFKSYSWARPQHWPLHYVDCVLRCVDAIDHGISSSPMSVYKPEVIEVSALLILPYDGERTTGTVMTIRRLCASGELQTQFASAKLHAL